MRLMARAEFRARDPAVIEARRRNLPRPTFPEELPVSGRRGDIARAISENQVVIVCGETGWARPPSYRRSASSSAAASKA